MSERGDEERVVELRRRLGLLRRRGEGGKLGNEYPPRSAPLADASQPFKGTLQGEEGEGKQAGDTVYLEELGERLMALLLQLDEWLERWEDGLLEEWERELQARWEDVVLGRLPRERWDSRWRVYEAEKQRAMEAWPGWQELLAHLEEYDTTVSLGPPACYPCAVEQGEAPHTIEAARAWQRRYGQRARNCPRHNLAISVGMARLRRREGG